MNLTGEVNVDETTYFQVFYRKKEEGYSQVGLATILLQPGVNNIHIPNSSKFIRIDPVSNIQNFYLANFKVSDAKQIDL